MSASAPRPCAAGPKTEFGLLCAPAEPSEATRSDLPGVERVAALVFHHQPVGYRSANLFLPSGGRPYLDIGAHPEYTTTECMSTHDLVTQNQADRAILVDMATRAIADLSQGETAVCFHLLANNTDSAGHTCSYRESYSMSRSLLDATNGTSGANSETTVTVLTSFLTMRPALVDSGHPLAGGPTKPGDGSRDAGREAAWGLSPHVPHLQVLTLADTTRQHVLINIRGEPHADATRPYHLHVIYTGTAIAEPTTGLRNIVTLLLLSALEVGWDFTNLILADPLVALPALGESPWGNVPATTTQGRCPSAIDIQEALLERLTSYLDDTGMPDFLYDTKRLLIDLAPHVISAPRHYDGSAVDTKVNQAIRRRLIRVQHEHHSQLNDQSLETLRLRIGLTYHGLNAETGLVPHPTAQSIMANLCDPEEVKRARQTPPTVHTALWGAFVAACLEVGASFSVSWESLRLDSPPTTPMGLPDPLEMAHKAAESLTQRALDLRPEEIHRIDLMGRDGLGTPD